MRIVFIGPPGAGKGTQCARLADHLGVPHLSTGDILRTAVSEGTELGKIVGPIMETGGLVSDELMLDVVNERLAQPDCSGGYLLDGFPRTVPQASAFYDFLEQNGQQLDAVIELRVPDEELRKRLELRFQEMDSPRADDQPDSIPRRLDIYHNETRPLLSFYADMTGVLQVVDGTGSMDEVFERILTAMG